MTADTTSESGAAVAQTEFVTHEFETTITDDDRDQVAEAVVTAVSNLRVQIDDSRLEDLLRADSGTDILKTVDTSERSQPEPFTQQAVISVLFDALGYSDLTPETGSYASGISKIADYSMPFEVSGDSNRLLIEAEPIGKKLKGRNDGVGQVKDWLSRREFESDFGFATDGPRWIFVRYDSDTYTHNIIQDVNLRPAFVAAFEAITTGGDPVAEVRSAAGAEIDRLFEAFARDNFLSIASEVREAVKRRQKEITEEFYEEYIRYVFGVVDDDEQTARSLIGEGITAPDGATGDDVRLFAVELMNRLLFVKFLEDRGIVRSDLLRTLNQTHDKGMYMGTFYETFLEPLFYGVFDTKPSERIEQISSRELFADIPYLNGGLFRPQVGDGEAFDESDFTVHDSVLKDIIDLLERYRFSTDGGPTDLDPSVLGNVFEKTINYITTDRGNRNKELGAYYTPDEITRFCAERTIAPGLRDRFVTKLVENWGWTEAIAEQYGTLDGLIEALPANTDLADDLLAEVNSFRALDPACGSGHFLTSVLAEIVGVRKSLHALRGEDPDDWLLRKKTVTQNVYGVDIVKPAVEIAKLRLWLSIIAEVDPEAMEEYDEDELALPNVVFNVRQGNSLIGFTELMETKGEENGDGSQQAALTSWGPDSVRAKYGNIISLVTRHKRTSGSDEAMEYLQKAEELLETYRIDLDEKVVDEFHEAGIENATLEQVRGYEPFHWVLEFASVYADGGFDVITGNPPWDQLRPSRDDFFSRHDERFRTRTSSEKEKMQSKLLNEQSIAKGWEDHQENMRVRAKYFNESPSYNLQNPTVAGRGIASENELSSLFLERIFSVAKDGARVAQVLPGIIFTGASAKDLRMKLLDESSVDTIIGFENHGIFDQIHNQYRFGTTVFEIGGSTDTLQGMFLQRNVGILEDIGIHTVEITKRTLDQFSPEARIFPSITNQDQADVLDSILAHPSLAEEINDKWVARPLREELHSARDTDRFFENSSEGDYPVYGGGNVYQYLYDSSKFVSLEPPKYYSVNEDRNPERSAKRRIREKRFNSGDLKKAIYNEFGGQETSESQKGFVNSLLEENRGYPLNIHDIRLDCTSCRIAYRDIARSSDERTMIATVLPAGIVCEDTLQSIRPHQIEVEQENLTEDTLRGAYRRSFTDREMFSVTGLLNSLPFDFLMSMKIETHISKYKFAESQMPRLTDGDDWFHYIAERAARLNCYGEAFAEMRERLGGIDPATEEGERRRLQAEIDAAAFHAYGLDREETEFVLDDFHRVENPRIMTEDHFDSVLQSYNELADRGPLS